MAGEPALVVFLGGFGDSPAEQLVDQARLAATLDTIDSWKAAVPGSQVIVVTDDASLLTGCDGMVVDADNGPFHFGRRLVEVVRKYELSHVVCMGGGSLPLLSAESLADVTKRVEARGGVTNNLFSSDLIGFPMTEEALAIVGTMERDNPLARALHERGGVTVEALPRTLETQYDIDTPTDVAALATTGQGGPRLREYLADAAIDTSRYRAVLPLFLDQSKQIMVAGRVGSHAWGYLERETACRVRLFAEERGMEADGRAESGAARSLLGYHLDAVGHARFFGTLAELGDAAFIDTRVLLAHERIDASREDRFLSDLGQWEDVREPWLRDFTRAAVEAAVPVLLGGHSLMAGGLMALNEHAWSLRDAGEL